MSYYIIIRGPLGCGKSTLASRLSKVLNARHFRIDEILEKHGLTKERESGYISQKSFIQANSIVAPNAQEHLKNGMPVVFDGNFYWRSQIEDLIKRLDYPHYIFTLNVPLKVCISRDGRRENPHGPAATKAVYRKSAEFDYGIPIDVTKPIGDCLREMISHLPKR